MQYNTIQYNTIGPINRVTCTMSVSWQNRRRGQSLVTRDMVKTQQQNNYYVFKLCLNELTGGEMQIFRGMSFQIC